MARIRTIKPEYFAHEELGSCSRDARLLGVALMQLADAEGRFRWVPRQVFAHAFPWDEDLSLADLEAMAVELERAGLIVRYEIEGRTFCHFPAFRTHQRITGKEAQAGSRLPPPEDADSSAVNAGETPGCFPGKHLGAQEQGTGNREREEEKNNVASPAATVDLLAPLEAPKEDPVGRVWRHYSEPRAVTRSISTEARNLIRSRLRSHSAEALCLVVDWSHDAPGALHLRENDRGKDYTRWSTIFAASNFAKYVEEAEEWHAAGRPGSTPAEAESFAAWWTEHGPPLTREVESYAHVWKASRGTAGADFPTVEALHAELLRIAEAWKYPPVQPAPLLEKAREMWPRLRGML